MTTEPFPENATRQLQLADEALSDAEYLLTDSRLKAAANRAYYAMFHAVQAALAITKAALPKTHAGTINMFGKHIVLAGKIEKRYAKDLQDAFDIRQQTDYQIYAKIGEAEVREMVTKAAGFIAQVKNLIG